MSLKWFAISFINYVLCYSFLEYPQFRWPSTNLSLYSKMDNPYTWAHWIHSKFSFICQNSYWISKRMTQSLGRHLYKMAESMKLPMIIKSSRGQSMNISTVSVTVVGVPLNNENCCRFNGFFFDAQRLNYEILNFDKVNAEEG